MVYKMPECPPVDNFRPAGSREISLPNFPMDLYMCSDCGHAQLLDVVDPEILYGNYIYTSSSSTDLDAHFTSYVQCVKTFLKLRPNARVLDVGSNDGLLLSKFKKSGFDVTGIDPSSYVATKASEKGIDTVVDYFNKKSAKRLVEKFGLFDLVTANNVFSHADNLREFAESADEVLTEDGAFVFEVSYLKDLVDRQVVDYIYHEHLCHHSVKPLKKFLASCNLKLVNVERVNTKGGSIRCYAVKHNNPLQQLETVERLISQEIISGLYDLTTYQNLSAKMNKLSAHLMALLGATTGPKESVAIYGASATCTVLNALLGINKLASFIVDDNKLRQNTLSPGFLLPVIAPEALTVFNPKYVVISAWRFAQDIIQRNQQYLSDGGCFIVPLPVLKEIRNDNS